MYVGSCAGSFLPARVGESFWHENPAARPLCLVNAPLVNSADSAWAGLTSPGVGTIEAAVARPSHWLARGLPPRFHLVHYNGPMFDTRWTGEDGALGRAVTVARFAGATDDFTPGEDFFERSAAANAPTVFDRGLAAGAATAVAAAVDDGLVVLFGSHPEFGLDAIQLGWGEGVRLFGNALAEQAVRRPHEAAAQALHPMAVDLAPLCAAFGRAADGFEALLDLPFARVAEGGPLPAFLGRTPENVWRDALGAAASAARRGARQARAWDGAGGCREATAVWLDAPASDGQDYGFVGLGPLLASANAMIERALANAGRSAAPLGHAYDGLERHPYQLAASSYLSAAGLAASGLLALYAFGTTLEGAPADGLLDVLLA